MVHYKLGSNCREYMIVFIRTVNTECFFKVYFYSLKKNYGEGKFQKFVETGSLFKY